MWRIDIRDLSFDWDEGNVEKNPIGHNVSNIESEEIFFRRPLVLEDRRHSQAESRNWALGITSQGRLLHITFTYREDKIRVVSARDMSKKERIIYENFKKTS